MKSYLIALACVAVLLVAYVTGGTLDIDEGFSIWLASHSTLANLWHALRTGDSSDLQMGLYYVYLWAWTHLFGNAEYTMRAANLPWAFLFAAAVGFTSWRVFQRPVAWAFLFLSPFLCFYVDEARAYTPVMACAAASSGALLLYLYESPRRLYCYLALGFLWLGICFHLLAVTLGPAFLVLAWWYRRDRVWFADWRKPVLLFAPLFVALGAYEAWTFTRGSMYGYGGPGFKYLAFIFYTFLGFGGLGPDRDTMQTPAPGAWGPYWPWLAFGLLLLVTAAVAIRQSRERAFVLLAAGLLPFALVEACTFVSGHRLPTRHFAPLLPLAFYWGLALLDGVPLRRVQTAVVALAMLWAVSDARLRTLPEHQKGDYRAAAQAALAHAGAGDIVWTGDLLTANYYGLALRDDFRARYYNFDYEQGIRQVAWPSAGQGIAAADWTPAQVAHFLAQQKQLHRPVVVALRKCDQVDESDAWLRYFASYPEAPVQKLRGFDLYLIR